MDIQKLLSKLQRLLDADRREQVAKRNSLKKVLKKLRKRRDTLQQEVAGIEDDGDRRQILEQIQVLNAQRQKGVALLRELRESKS